MNVKKRIYQNNNRENRQNKIKKQKSFIINTSSRKNKFYFLDLSHDQSKNQINNIREKQNYNRNIIFNANHNIKKNISFDNKIKGKNKDICINLQKEYQKDKNLYNHKVLNKTPEQKINKKKKYL